MMKQFKWLSSFAVVAFSAMTLSVGAKELPKIINTSVSYDEVGILDGTSGDFITVSDELYSLSKLTSCFDVNGRKDIGCYSLKKSRWVALILDKQHAGSVRVVKSIHQLSEAKFKALTNDD